MKEAEWVFFNGIITGGLVTLQWKVMHSKWAVPSVFDGLKLPTNLGGYWKGMDLGGVEEELKNEEPYLIFPFSYQ